MDNSSSTGAPGTDANHYRDRAAERLQAALDGTPATLTEWERALLATSTDNTPTRYTTADENAAAEDILDTEARYATELITEAEATAGTWGGDWIGDHPTT